MYGGRGDRPPTPLYFLLFVNYYCKFVTDTQIVEI